MFFLNRLVYSVDVFFPESHPHVPPGSFTTLLHLVDLIVRPLLWSSLFKKPRYSLSASAAIMLATLSQHLLIVSLTISSGEGREIGWFSHDRLGADATHILIPLRNRNELTVH